MTSPTDPEANPNSKTTNLLILIVGIIIIGLLALITFLLIRNNANTPDPGSSQPPQIELPEHLPNGPIVTAIEAINIRSGPGTDYPSYGVAPAGSVAEVMGISSDGGWWVIKIPTNIAPSGQGWVSGDYVQADNIGDPPVIEPPPLQ